jgi:ADP-ribose pyrophosphatase
VRRDVVRLPDAACHARDIVHPGAVLIVPVLPDGRLVVERQFRYPLNRVFIEFPAGKRDPGESTQDAARRELREEAGYEATRWTPLGAIHTLISYTNEQIDLFVAEGLRNGGDSTGASFWTSTLTEEGCWRRSIAVKSTMRRPSRRCSF